MKNSLEGLYSMMSQKMKEPVNLKIGQMKFSSLKNRKKKNMQKKNRDLRDIMRVLTYAQLES